ncbi:MAG: glycoside hydrolase family 6 protein [Nocardioidaceae bacterium]|nr:glycoside hydrolase family 6 protein [Nocardioidaceae bacterium]
MDRPEDHASPNRAQINFYIQDSQKGDPNKRIQLALFGLFPRGEDARHIPLTDAEVNNYRAWIDAAANALGQTKALIVLEPDLAVNFKGQSALKMQLARYAAQRLSQNQMPPSISTAVMVTG